MPTSGHESIHCGAQSVLSHPGMGTIISPALEFRMRHERNALKLFSRVELSAPERGSPVTHTALRWGFGHLGQFSANYQRRFGQQPSATLRRRQA